MAEKEIDPRFFLPPGVVDLSYSDKEDTTTSGEESSSDTTPTVEIADPSEWELPTPDESSYGPVDATVDERLLSPDYITVVSQSVKITSGGAVVDVVIDVEDVPGATQYEVRMTKS